MKKVLLTFVFALVMLPVSVFAGNDTKAEAVSYMPSDIDGYMKFFKDKNKEQIVDFYFKLIPQLKSSERNTVEKYVDMTYAYADSNYDVLMEIFRQLAAAAGNTQETMKLLSAYTQKVLPIALYVLDNRVTPKMAPDVDNYSVDTTWAAPIDEMYYGLGDDRNVYKPYGMSEAEIADHKAKGARVKHNQSYLWGMVTVGDKVYWCTNTNYLCVGGSSSGLGSAVSPGQDLSKGYENGCWTCEFESGIYGRTVHGAVKPEYAQYSDTRIPRIYCYDSKTGFVEDITPSGGEYDMMLQNCQGLRSAGSHNGVVFFGGPSLYGSSAGQTVGASFFALDDETGKFISCNDMSQVDGNKITDIRRWLVYDNVLYCGVRVTDKNGKDRGAVLRWYGDKKNPWQFKVVGWMAPEAAELEVFNGRMYVGGWNTASKGYCTVNKGPMVPEGGLQPVDINDPEWPEVWGYYQYDKNPLSARSTYTAGMMQWKGKLYWGTFAAAYTIPTIAAAMGYTDLTSPEALAFILGSLRQTSFWCIDENDKVQLLYGESMLPKWNKMDEFDQYGRPVGPDTWTNVKNNFTPRWGRAGYGELFTAYSWTIVNYHGDMYVGTMNMENLIGGVADADEGMSDVAQILKLITGMSEEGYGFELLRFKDPNTKPEYITTNGFGNGTAYGIRNFTVCGDDLFIGSASPLNLKEYGGCHLFKMNEDKGVPTAISAKKAGAFFKRNGSNIDFASVGGENIENVTVYDAAGRVLKSIKPNSNVASVATADLAPEVVIVKVTTANGSWTKQIKK